MNNVYTTGPQTPAADRHRLGGVINAFDWLPAASPQGYRRTEANGYTITYRREWAAWVRQMSRHADPIWATMWQADAIKHFAPATGIGVGIDRYIDFHAHQRAKNGLRTGFGVGSYKHPDVVATVGNRPFVWIDDDLEPDQHDWAWERNRTIPTMLVQPDPSVGLTRAQAAQVSAFLRRAGIPSAV